jgi:hypothetical protein
MGHVGIITSIFIVKSISAQAIATVTGTSWAAVAAVVGWGFLLSPAAPSLLSCCCHFQPPWGLNCPPPVALQPLLFLPVGQIAFVHENVGLILSTIKVPTLILVVFVVSIADMLTRCDLCNTFFSFAKSKIQRAYTVNVAIALAVFLSSIILHANITVVKRISKLNTSGASLVKCICKVNTSSANTIFCCAIHPQIVNVILRTIVTGRH